MDEARPVRRPSPGEVGFKCWPGRSLGRAFARFWPKYWTYGHATPRRTRRADAPPRLAGATPSRRAGPPTEISRAAKVRFRVEAAVKHGRRMVRNGSAA